MDFKDKIITLDNNKKYFVMDYLEYKNKIYIYLINKENVSDSIFREVLNESDLKVKEIDQDLFRNEIFPLFLNKFRNFE